MQIFNLRKLFQKYISRWHDTFFFIISKFPTKSIIATGLDSVGTGRYSDHRTMKKKYNVKNKVFYYQNVLNFDLLENFNPKQIIINFINNIFLKKY